jgi:hypothetical protein
MGPPKKVWGERHPGGIFSAARGNVLQGELKRLIENGHTLTGTEREQKSAMRKRR